MTMHKDQQRLLDVLVPQIIDRTMEDSKEALLDCTILNRALCQGPDPLFLMWTCPTEFATLCRLLELPVEDGQAGIEAAHWKGPGVFLADGGDGLPMEGNVEDGPVAMKQEALWLVLAAMSDCTEQSYSNTTTMLDRMQRVTNAAMKLATLTYWLEELEHPEYVFRKAQHALQNFMATAPLTINDRGFAHGDVDHAFYCAYKQGYKVCAVKAGDKVFWGTIPSTTLAEQGITVDKILSPSFGIIFNHAS